MPIIKSAIKKMRQDVKRKSRNNVYRVKMKNQIKNVLKGVHDKSDDVQKRLDVAQSLIDIALKKKLIKKNTAARKKARLARLANSVQLKN